MKDETMGRFLGLMTELPELKPGEALIPYGKFDDNIYVVRSGIMRYVYFDGLKETTFGFALPGTVMISYFSYCKREPSFFQVEACCDSVVIKVEKGKFLELVGQSADFAQWVIWMQTKQLLGYEKKLAVVNGDARKRFESLVRNRPEIMEKVPMKVIASYIGITPQYFSNLKKDLTDDHKK
jgi:CRP-like cAMP-binding protein